jgi:cobalamin biosynthesis protein CbiG
MPSAHFGRRGLIQIAAIAAIPGSVDRISCARAIGAQIATQTRAQHAATISAEVNGPGGLSPPRGFSAIGHDSFSVVNNRLGARRFPAAGQLRRSC